MGEKSRWGWHVSMCLKMDCVNRGEGCKDCWKCDNYRSQEYQDYLNSKFDPRD